MPEKEKDKELPAAMDGASLALLASFEDHEGLDTFKLMLLLLGWYAYSILMACSFSFLTWDTQVKKRCTDGVGRA